MKFPALKKLRVIISLLFFLLTAFLFLDFTNALSYKAVNTILFLQFVPSALLFVNLLSYTAIGFLIVITLTLLFGRIYCSTICPLGTLQDIIIYVSKKLKINKRFTYQRTYNWLRYSILIVTVTTFLFGNIILINLLDPFSNFGRIFSNLIRPVYLFANNVSVSVLELFDCYYLYPVNLKTFVLFTFIFAFFFLIMIIWMAIRGGRIYCNTICPVGTLLGMISKISLFRISIDKSMCDGCWTCSLKCKAGCIHGGEKKIDYSRCVVCFDCLNSCKSNAVKFKIAFRRKKKPLSEKEPNNKRREFLITTGIFSLSLTGLAFGTNKIEDFKKTNIPDNKKYPVCPPGSLSIEHFTTTCTACHLCVSACPTQVLKPSFLEYGLMGMMQPYMNYFKSFCNYDCVICSEICPSGAILPISLEEKKLTQLGKVNFIKENCIVETEGTDCGACSEHCPTKAVYMVPYKDNLVIPEINQDICIGCGACEFACPTKPFKAIYVDGNPIHLKAKKPEKEILNGKIDYEEDFPF